MGENIWPENNTDSLETLCLRTCVQNPETFSYSENENIHLRPGVNLLPGVCDRLITTLQEDDILDTKWLNLFRDKTLTRLCRINLTECHLTSEHMEILSSHPIQDLILKNTVLPQNIVKCVNHLHRTLRVLKFDSDDEVLEGATIGDLVLHELSTLGADIDDCRRGNVFGRDYIFNCPNLRILSLRNFDFKSFNNSDTLGTILCPLTRLSHLDLTRSFVEVEFMDCLEVLHNLMWLCLSNVRILDLKQAMENICKCPKLR